MTTPRESASALSVDAEIPDKLYFKIGEVARLVGVQTHVLRYWEREIASIRPSKSASNQRRYRRKDVEIFREVRRLLYEERYTLAGAKQRLSGGGEPAPAVSPQGPSEDRQLPLGLAGGPAPSNVEAVKAGLRDLIRFANESIEQMPR